MAESQGRKTKSKKLERKWSRFKVVFGCCFVLFCPNFWSLKVESRSFHYSHSLAFYTSQGFSLCSVDILSVYLDLEKILHILYYILVPKGGLCLFLWKLGWGFCNCHTRQIFYPCLFYYYLLHYERCLKTNLEYLLNGERVHSCIPLQSS